MSSTFYTLVIIFAISVLGYLFGSIRIKGIGFGTAGIFMVGLLFGHFGFSLPSELQNFGLVLFITAVGIGAGPGFLQRIKKNGVQYAALCLVTAAVGGLLCFLIIQSCGIDSPLAVGILTGAFTTSPGFAAAKEAVSAESALRVAAGYGIAYPIGVVCKVLFVQLAPKLLLRSAKTIL